MGKHILRVFVATIIGVVLFTGDVRAEVVLGDNAKHVICNIMYAVESGGQVYGNCDYGDITEAYTNSKKEHAITIGAGQFYGVNAKKLLDKIRSEYPDVFNRLDTAGIGTDLDTSDWSRYKISKGSSKAKCIQAIITTDEGKKAQDDIMFELFIKDYLADANEVGITDVKTAALYIQAAHLNPPSLKKRVKNDLPESQRNFEGLYNFLVSGTSANAVNGSTYRSRHTAAKKMIEEHAAELNDTSTSNSVGSTGTYSGLIVSEWDLVGMPGRSALEKGYAEVRLPDSFDLSSSEAYSVSTIKSNIVANNTFKLFDMIRVFVVFLGLLLIIYSVLMAVAYLFDKANNIFEISLLGIITLGVLRYSDEEGVSRRGYVDSKKIIKISGLCTVVGLFIVSGGVFSWAVKFISMIGGIL